MQPKTEKTIIAAAWVVILLSSALPKIILQELFGQTVSWELQAALSLSIALIALLLTFAWRPLSSLRPLLILLIVLVAAQWLVYLGIGKLPIFQRWQDNQSFNVSMLAEQTLNMMVALIMIGALLLMKKKRADFYLVVGDTAAPVEPIRWLGVQQGARWNRFGMWLAICLSLGTLAFLVIAGRPQLGILIQVLPFLPVILLAAAMNAFYEEVTYKASFLSVLEGPVGPRQALYMVAVFFGIWHFYGVPYGVIGVILATFLGWLLARSMQETRGLFWAWFIHFWQDVWIFSFLAIGSIIPGGG